jgi:beta-fructofuranosidase
MPGECLVEATVQFSPGTAACGVLLRASGELNQYYQVRLEPAAQRIVVDLWPRPGDKPFVFERPLALQPDRPVRLRCLTSGTNLVVYVDDETALSCRMYDHPAGSAGLFAIEGTVQFSQLAVRAI